MIVGVLMVVIIGINHLTFGGVSKALHFIGEPVWKSQSGVVSMFSNMFVAIKSKQDLLHENESLHEEINRLGLMSIESEILRLENESFRQLLNRETSRDIVAGAVLARPSRTFYDTFVIDVGRRDGITKGARVFGTGDVAVGTVVEVYAHTSLISLNSTPGRSTEVLLGSELISTDALGRGGGDFEIRIPRGVEVAEGDPIFSPDLDGGIFGVVEEIVALPADSFQTILFSSPINIQLLRLVTVELL